MEETQLFLFCQIIDYQRPQNYFLNKLNFDCYESKKHPNTKTYIIVGQ